MTYEESVQLPVQPGTRTRLAAAGERHEIRPRKISPCFANTSGSRSARFNRCTSPARTEKAPRPRCSNRSCARRACAPACTLRRIWSASTNAFAWTARKFPTRISPPRSRACTRPSRNCSPPGASPRIPHSSSASPRLRSMYFARAHARIRGLRSGHGRAPGRHQHLLPEVAVITQIDFDHENYLAIRSRKSPGKSGHHQAGRPRGQRRGAPDRARGDPAPRARNKARSWWKSKNAYSPGRRDRPQWLLFVHRDLQRFGRAHSHRAAARGPVSGSQRAHGARRRAYAGRTRRAHR